METTDESPTQPAAEEVSELSAAEAVEVPSASDSAQPQYSTDEVQVEAAAPAESDEPQPIVEIPVPTPRATATNSAVTNAAKNELKDQTFGGYKESDTVELKDPIFLSATEKDLRTRNTLIRFAPDTQERVGEVLDNYPEARVKDDPEIVEWSNDMQRSLLTSAFKGFWLKSMRRKGSKWRQGLASEKGNLAFRVPVWKDNAEKLTGERALLHVRALIGHGSLLDVPLFHSGFWVRLKAPSDSALVELYQTIGRLKTELGRQTYGLAYSNKSAFYNGAVFDFVMRHVYDTTLKNRNDVRKNVNMLDLYTLVWGIARLIWNKGFYYERPTLDDEGNPGKVISGMVNIAKMFLVDNTSLDSWQIAHMSNSNPGVHNDENIRLYRERFLTSKGRTIELAENLSLTLKMPTVEEHLTSGNLWVNNVALAIEKAFELSPDDTQRDRLINEQANATIMRQYGHMIESINGPFGSLTSVDDIDRIIGDALSGDAEISRKFFEAVQTFIEDGTVAVVATPVEEEKEAPYPRFPFMLPVDVMSTFFITLVQKNAEISRRTA